MKAKLDFTTKTIEFDEPVTFEDLQQIQAALTDWRKWRVTTPISFIPTYVPTYPSYPVYPQWPYITWTSINAQPNDTKWIVT